MNPGRREGNLSKRSPINTKTISLVCVCEKITSIHLNISNSRPMRDALSCLTKYATSQNKPCDVTSLGDASSPARGAAASSAPLLPPCRASTGPRSAMQLRLLAGADPEEGIGAWGLTIRAPDRSPTRTITKLLLSAVRHPTSQADSCLKANNTRLNFSEVTC